jgi:benzoate membrane transport protein
MKTRPGATRRRCRAGRLYVLIGIFGAAVTGLLTAFPKELVVAIAGLALLGTIGSGLAVALKDENHREAALITFLVTLSGVSIAGIGSAFWGVVAGAIALFVQQYAHPRTRRRRLPLKGAPPAARKAGSAVVPRKTHQRLP